MKKLLFVFGVLFLILGLVGCGSPKKNTTHTKKSLEISIDSTSLQTNSDMKATISGTTSANASIIIKYDKLGMGYESDIKTLKTTADNSGHFSKTVNWQANYTVYAKKGNEKSKEIIVNVKHSNAAKKAITKETENKEQKDQHEAKENSKDISFQMLDKNADNYINEPYYIKGEVVQAIEDGGETLLRVNITKDEYGDYDNTVAVLYDDVTDAVEDDIIEVYGKIYGKYKYESTIGAKLTVPGIQADSIKVLK
ncbi:hypothetical protein ACVWSE_001045 [Listeria monocytogenes]